MKRSLITRFRGGNSSCFFLACFGFYLLFAAVRCSSLSYGFFVR
jgi:hypothetical protein